MTFQQSRTSCFVTEHKHSVRRIKGLKSFSSLREFLNNLH